jgi:hypothetical protein
MNAGQYLALLAAADGIRLDYCKRPLNRHGATPFFRV